MAKMFYTLEEAAAKLGVTAEQIKQMAAGGKLQQFRDRDKLMYKRDQIDSLASKGGSGDAISLSSGDDTDRIDLAASDTKTPPGRKEDPRQATGISVFDADEVETADPMAQTQVTPAGAEEEVALESVGSGSGLLDLTRESDDTSLGAELLDEIYPGTGEGSDAKMDQPVPTGSGLEAVAEGSGASGLENQLQSAGQPGVVPIVMSGGEAYDPAGDGLSFGFLLGTAATLIILLIVAISAVAGVPSNLTKTLSQSSGTLLACAAGLLVVSIILGVIGYFVGRSRA